MRHNKLPGKYQSLINILHTNDKDDFYLAQEKLDLIKKECMVSSEKKCRKICAGAVDYSNEVFMWKHRQELWNLVLQYHKGFRINTTVIRRKAKTLGISAPLSSTLAEAERARTICKDAYNKLKPNAPEHRKNS